MSIEYVAMGAKPDPFKFTILKREVVVNDIIRKEGELDTYMVGGTIILANYEGCKTYDGNKLMLCEGYISPDITTLDPHFLEGHHVIARFKPTEQGWKLARLCAQSL